jgi:hypothetical protein
VKRWALYFWSFVVAAWEFMCAPSVNLDTDWSPEHPPELRNFHIYVVNRRGETIFRASVVESTLCKEEIELLFIGEGVPHVDIVVTEVTV